MFGATFRIAVGGWERVSAHAGAVVRFLDCPEAVEIARFSHCVIHRLSSPCAVRGVFSFTEGGVFMHGIWCNVERVALR